MRILINPTQMSFKFRVPDLPASEGIQKGKGFSRGWHHWNSVRLGFNRSEGSEYVRLFLYGYYKGKQTSHTIVGLFEPNQTLHAHIFWNENYKATIELFDTDGDFKGSADMLTPKSTLPLGYELNPYAEVDGETNERIDFKFEYWDLKIK